MIDRRVRLLEAEGIEFNYNVDVGRDIPPSSCAKATTRS